MLASAMRVALVGILLFVGACGSDSTGSSGESPLTVEQWKPLPPETKYTIETLERVRASDPRFQDERSWRNFLRRVVLPAKKRETGQATLN